MRKRLRRLDQRADPILTVLGRPTNVPRDERVQGDATPAETARPTIQQAIRQGAGGLLRLLGPGIITGAADDDPSAIATYSQAGSQAGYGLLWSCLFTLPLMMGVQELTQRIALQTGAGLGVNLQRKFPTWLVGAAVLLLVVANVITLGADLQAVAAGFELLSGGWLHAWWLIAPIAVVLLGFQLFGRYATLYRVFQWLALALVAYVIASFLAHPNPWTVLRATFIPHVEFTGQFLLLLVAVLGTTLSPYLFFWQPALEIDNMEAAGKLTVADRAEVSDADLQAARADTFVGMVFSQLVAYCIIVTAAVVLYGHGKTNIQSAAEAAQALTPFAGRAAFIFFAVGLIGTGLLAIPVLSASAAYAVKEVARIPGNLASKPIYRPTFYAIIGIATALGVAMNLLNLNVIQALIIASALSGVAAVPLLVLMTLFG